jgi:hypothetical protein
MRMRRLCVQVQTLQKSAACTETHVDDAAAAAVFACACHPKAKRFKEGLKGRHAQMLSCSRVAVPQRRSSAC